jgi:hypothetical protein
MRHLKNFKDSGKFSSFFIGCKGKHFAGILQEECNFFEQFSSKIHVFG